jgi:hypothetical protein
MKYLGRFLYGKTDSEKNTGLDLDGKNKSHTIFHGYFQSIHVSGVVQAASRVSFNHKLLLSFYG